MLLLMIVVNAVIRSASGSSSGVSSVGEPARGRGPGAGRACRRPRRGCGVETGLRAPAASGVLAFGATLLTPLGVSLWPEVWRSLNRSQVNRISEWMPPVFEPRFALFWILALAFAWLAATRWRFLEHHADRFLVAVSVFLLVLAIRASRNVVPFALVAVPALSRLLWLRAEVARRHQAAGRDGAQWLDLPSLRHPSWSRSWRFIGTGPRSRPVRNWDPLSPQAASAIRSCPPPIYNHYDAGGFIIWFVPEQRVFLDSRQDPYPPRLIRAHREATTPAALGEMLERYRIRCAVIEAGSYEAPALRANGWAIMYVDTRWTVMTPPAVGRAYGPS